MMKRFVDEELEKWQRLERRKPLIVRGARQVGKTYSIENFGRKYFEDIVTIDLERNRNWHRVFENDLDSSRITAELELLAGRKIRAEGTLLFFDEIQSCPRALAALRYFYEEKPSLHVIAAGSLLEFALGELSFPVGRVQFLEMHPLTFAEYLMAIDKEPAAEMILQAPQPTASHIHDMLLQELDRYYLVGGMPESVAVYANTRSFESCFDVHRELIAAYRQDFTKYAARADPHCLDTVFANTARHIGGQIKYARLAEDYAGTTIKRAFELLCKARVIKKVESCSPAGLPLNASASLRKFKALLIDIGLWQHLCGVRIQKDTTPTGFVSAHRGAMAEQFVGQEMMVSQNSEIYYWARRAKSSTAEVDYLAVMDDRIYGIEVKSGASGRLKSLHMLLEKYPNVSGGFVFSEAPYSTLPEQKLTFLPLYYAYSATKSL